MIKAFALALFAASVVAQDGMATTMDMPEEMKPADAADEEKHRNEESVAILQSLIDIVCESDMDHMSEEAKKETMEEQGGADATTMDMATTEEEKKKDDHSAEDVEKMRNSKLCLKAREMLKDIVEYADGDHDVRRKKAEKWGGVAYDVVADLIGDGAASMTAYGATVIAAIALTAF